MITNINLSLGVRAVEEMREMREKFSTQKSNKNQLEMEVKDAEKRLAAAKKAYNRHEMLFQVTNDMWKCSSSCSNNKSKDGLLMVVYSLNKPQLAIHLKRVIGPELVVVVVMKVFIIVVVVVVVVVVKVLV